MESPDIESSCRRRPRRRRHVAGRPGRPPGRAAPPQGRPPVPPPLGTPLPVTAAPPLREAPGARATQGAPRARAPQGAPRALGTRGRRYGILGADRRTGRQRPGHGGHEHPGRRHLRTRDHSGRRRTGHPAPRAAAPRPPGHRPRAQRPQVAPPVSPPAGRAARAASAGPGPQVAPAPRSGCRGQRGGTRGAGAPRVGVPRVSGTAAPGSLVALAGPSGTGRTCLLLALTGRMRIKEGHADVGGLRLPLQDGGRPPDQRPRARTRRVRPGPGVHRGRAPAEAALLRRRFDGSPLALPRPRSERVAENRRRIDAALGRSRAWTRRACRRASGPPCATWSGWRHCGCRSRWRSSANRACWPWTTPT